MKTLTTIALLALVPDIVLGTTCNADNVLRALRANSAQASPFCSTYTLPPPNQPLPTYVSQYPASRVSSACTCLITTTTTSTATTLTTSTTSTTTSSSPTPTFTDPCRGDLIQNGGFENTVNYQPVPWIFAPETQNNGQSTVASTYTGNGNTYA